MRVYSHPSCLQHDPGPGHPECPARLQAVLDALQSLPGLEWRPAPAATRAQVARVHVPALIARVLDSGVESSLRLDEDTVLSPASAQAALHACGAGVAAVDGVVAGPDGQAFCAVRPPGHHATAATAMGFCLFNSIAVAAAHALGTHGLQRVAIADFDVHHGNGSQDIFAGDPRVLYLSSHQSPLYPGTGTAPAAGDGNAVNAPLPPGSGSDAFRAAWRDGLLPVLDAFRPQLLLVSAGFDAHRLDPLADLQLEAADFAWLAGELAAVAGRHAQGRMVSLLEGGYSLAALSECSAAYVRALAT